MANLSDHRAVIEAERRLLRALCQETPDESIREAARRILAEYSWRDPIHQVVFNCLIDIPSESPLTVHEHLPGRVTRKGFPDVPWEEFFQPISISRKEAEDLMRQLRDASSRAGP